MHHSLFTAANFQDSTVSHDCVLDNSVAADPDAVFELNVTAAISLPFLDLRLAVLDISLPLP